MPNFQAQTIAVQGYAQALAGAVEQAQLHKVALEETRAIALQVNADIVASTEEAAVKVSAAMTAGITESGEQAAEQVRAVGIQVAAAAEEVQATITRSTGDAAQAAEGFGKTLGTAMESAQQAVQDRGAGLRSAADKAVEEAHGSLSSGLQGLEDELDQGIEKLNNSAGSLDIEKTFEEQGLGLRRLIDDSLKGVQDFIEKLKGAGDEQQAALARILEGVRSGLFKVNEAREAAGLFGEEALRLFDSLDTSRLRKDFQDFLDKLREGQGTADEVADEISKRLEGSAKGVREAFEAAREAGVDALREWKEQLGDLLDATDAEGLQDLLDELLKRDEGRL